MTSVFEVLHTKETEEIARAKKNLETRDKKRTNKEEAITPRFFLICQRCFWCASFIDRVDDTQNLFVKACPTCNDHNIESLPLLYNERYHFEYTEARGVVLEFLR